MPSTAITGADIGMAIDHQTRRRLAPSIMAASSIDDDMERKYCRVRKVPNGVTICGTISPAYESSQPRSRTTMYRGTRVT